MLGTSGNIFRPPLPQEMHFLCNYYHNIKENHDINQILGKSVKNYTTFL